MRRALVLLLLVPALAGCTSGPDDGSDPAGTDDGSDDGPFQIMMPEWQVGRWWSYTSDFGDHTLVVTEENGASWTIDTTDANYAFFHDAFGEISYLGEIRKSDLAGAQDGTAVQFFDWPLENNKQWRATWDGIDLDMVAHVSDTGVAHVVASQGETVVNQFVYDDAVGWFTEMIWNDPETGEEFGRMELADSGSGFSGELVRVDAEVIDGTTYSGVQSQGATFYDGVEGDDADAYLILEAACETGQFLFAIGTVQALTNTGTGAGPFEDQGHTIQSACPNAYAFSGVIGSEPGNGDQWGHLITSESPDLELTFTLYVRHFERITL